MGWLYAQGSACTPTCPVRGSYANVIVPISTHNPPKPHLPRYKHPPGQRKRPGLVRLPLPQQRVGRTASASLPAQALGRSIYGLLPRLLPLLLPIVRVIREQLQSHPHGALQVSLRGQGRSESYGLQVSLHGDGMGGGGQLGLWTASQPARGWEGGIS